MAVKRRRKRSTDLVESGRQDRHEESVVDVAHQLVSDIRVGHLGTATSIQESRQAEALQNSSELRNWTRGGIRSQSSLCRQCQSALGTCNFKCLLGRMLKQQQQQSLWLRSRHDEQQGVPGLLAHRALPVDEGDEQGEDEEVGGPLVLTGVEEQLQDGGVFGQNAAQLVEQQHQLGLHLRRGGARAGRQQHDERPQDGLVVQQGLARLAHQHLVHLELLQLHVVGELAAEAPHEEALHHVLHHHELQDGAHGAGLTALLLHQQEQHVLHVVLHRARLVSGHGAEARAGAATAAAEVEDIEGGQGGAAAQGIVLFQDLHHLQRETRGL
ncbi:hypothetical protein EYF80_000185 [Liparis tanakae]|uniref:Uncharacterized protein n=1 Tax=Liparis tanakae TaxID=230148 RepID=A0A4Z2JK09_9TELE|nr:hypothetical protein EYF80_000185 [Liparis tanakae]